MNKIFNGLKITVHHQAWILERFLLTTHITTHINRFVGLYMFIYSQASNLIELGAD